MKKDYIILALLCLFNLGLAILSFGGFVVEDAAIHAEISSLILHNGHFITTYQPVSDTLLTYPPLFHYLAAFLGLLMPIITSVRLLGAISFAILPLSAYFASKTLTKKPIVPAIAAAAMANLSFILVFSAFPQLLALNFYFWFLHFFFRSKKIVAGVFAGLAIITHPFTGFFTGFTLLALLVFYKKQALKTVLAGLVVSMLWAKQYFLIIVNMVSNSWNNARWVEVQGFHFEQFSSLLNVLFYRLNIVIFGLAIAGFVLFMNSQKHNWKKKVVFGAIFGLPLLFTIYHLGPAQYKFLDMLSVPLILFSGMLFGWFKFPKKSLSRVFVIGAIVLVLLASFFLPVKNVYDFTYSREKSFSSFDYKYYGAAVWLRQNRQDFSRVVLLDNSSIEKPPKNFSSELVFSQIAQKCPMDGTISDLEKYSESYKKQLEDRKLIIMGDFTKLEKYDIKYVVGDCQQNVIYKSKGVNICEIK